MSNIPKEKLENRQFRNMQTLETKNENEKKYLVKGYAMKYNPYLLYEDEDGEVFEEFRKEAFKDTDMSDVILLYDHQGKVYARNTNDTLKVGLDDVGMWIEADLSSNERTKSLYEDIQSGLITKMSWSFKTGEYHFDKQSRTIVHDSVKKVYDVSAVGIPANNDTNINVRKFVDGVIDKFKAERLLKEQKRKKLLLKLKIEGEING